MSRCRSWMARSWMVTICFLFLTLNAAGQEAERCELLLRERPAAEGSGLFAYLLMAGKTDFSENLIDYGASTNSDLFKSFKAAVTGSAQECIADYFGADGEITDDHLADFLFHFRDIPKVLASEDLELVDVVYYRTSETLQNFLKKEGFNSWRPVWDFNGLPLKDAGTKSLNLRLPRNQRRVPLVLLRPDDLPPASEQGNYEASKVLAAVAARGKAAVNLAKLTPEPSATSGPNSGPGSSSASTTGNENTGGEEVDQKTLFSSLMFRFTKFRRVHIALVALLFGLMVGGLVAYLAKTGVRWRRGLQYAQGARFLALAKTLDPQASIPNARAAEAFFQDQTHLLLELSASLGKLSQGQEAPEGLSTRERIVRLIDQLRQQLKSQGQKTWRDAGTILAEHNKTQGLGGPSPDLQAVNGETAFRQLLASSGDALKGLRTELESTAKKLGQEKSELERLLNNQNGAPTQGPLHERLDAYLSDYVGGLKGAIHDIADFLQAFGKGSLEPLSAQNPPASLQRLQHHAAQVPPVKVLLEQARGVYQNRVADQQRKTAIAAALRQAYVHLDDYHRIAGLLRAEKREEVAGEPETLVHGLVAELSGLKTNAENQRKEKFIIDILRVAMEASVHLNQAVSIWRSKGDTTIALQLLGSGLDKLNLYALALLEGQDLKPVDAAGLLIGDDDRPGQLTALLRILAVIRTQRAYVEVWGALPGDVRHGLGNADRYLRHLLDQLGIEAHDFQALTDPGALGVEYRTEKSLIVLEEEPFKRELGALTRDRPWTSTEVVVEFKQLGFNVDPQGLSSLKIRQWPSFLCVAKSSQLERYAREYK